MTRTTRTTLLRWLERLAWGVGVVCLATVGWVGGASARAEGEAIHELDRLEVEHRIAQAQAQVLTRLGQPAADVPAAAFPARLEIPRLGLAVLVSPGTDAGTLDLTAGHIDGTALPGSSGHVALAAHRDRHFRPLREVREGDVVTLTTPGGTVRYQVESTRVVSPQAVSVLAPTPYAALSLVTCFPFDFVGPAPERFVVHARRVG